MSIEGYAHKNEYNDTYSIIAGLINMNLKSYFKDIPNEGSHSKRVSELCRLIGIAMGLPATEVNMLSISGLLHDIGKNSIDKRILDKAGPLTQDEWNEIKRHPITGYKILNSSKDTKEIAKYVLYHHERYDGTGYPIGLKGDDIPLFSRIIAVADSYDAMTNIRTYRKMLDKKMAIGELMKNKDTQFDSEIIDIFISKVL